MSDENQETSYVAPASAPESGDTAAPEDADTGTQEGSEEQPQDDQEAPRTFTQAELDKIVQERVAKAERKARRELEAQAAEAQRPANGEPPTRDKFPAGQAGDEAFFKAAVDYTADQKLLQKEQQKQEVQVETAYQEREEGVREKYPDFQDVVYKKVEDGGPPITDLMRDLILRSDQGPEMVYHLGKNPSESRRIAHLDPVDQVKEMTKLELKFASAPAPKKTSAAPAPIRPLTGNSTPTPKYSVEDPRSDKSMSHEEWIRERNRTAAR